MLRKIADINQRYHLGNVIGSGTFGQVRYAVHKKLNLICAIKIIDKKHI